MDRRDVDALVLNCGVLFYAALHAVAQHCSVPLSSRRSSLAVYLGIFSLSAMCSVLRCLYVSRYFHRESVSCFFETRHRELL